MNTLEWLKNLYINEISLVNKYNASKKDYPMKNRGRSHHGLLYTYKGTEIYHFRDRTLEAVPNSILYIPRGEKYAIELAGETSEVIVFDFEPMHTEEIRPFCLQFGTNITLRPYFVEAELAWHRKEPDYSAFCKTEFYRVISSMIRHKVSYSSSATYNRLNKAILHLHEHYLERSFKIEELSGLVNMSPRYFEMLFQNEFKMTPKEYVTHLKLELAKELLLNEKSTVTGIAEQLGYNDVYHFSKMFKAKTGVNPSDYRRKNTKAKDKA